MDIDLLFNPNTIRISKYGSITGQIYFMFENRFFFPEEKWNDFLVVILGWWLENLIGLLNNTIIKCELDFMDGPFSLLLEKQNNNIKIKCINNDQDIIEYQIVVDAIEFSELVSKLTEKVVNYCDDNNWTNRDVIKLEKNNIEIIKQLNHDN